MSFYTETARQNRATHTHTHAREELYIAYKTSITNFVLLKNVIDNYDQN